MRNLQVVLVVLAFGFHLTFTCDKGNCRDLGSQTVCHDPCCSHGNPLAGCNAGGQGQNCRFCGFGPYSKCPSAAEPTTGGATVAKQSAPGDCKSTATQNCVQVVNNCKQTIFVGILGEPSIPMAGGFQLNQNGAQNVMVDANWSGRFWGRTGCFQCGQCATGDCGGKLQCNGAGGVPPVTLAEITFRGAGGLDYYDVSNVDGFNIPMRFAPIPGTFNVKAQNYTCTESNCLVNLNSNCPVNFAVKDVNGKVVACKSACLAYNTDEFCCKGVYNDPAKCKATRYANQVKAQCPLAYSYAYDDVKSTFTCKGNIAPSAAYRVSFC